MAEISQQMLNVFQWDQLALQTCQKQHGQHALTGTGRLRLKMLKCMTTQICEPVDFVRDLESHSQSHAFSPNIAQTLTSM